MARHDPDDGQWNRCHDDQRYKIGVELRHHQQINQNHPHAVSDAHVTEGFIRNLPFAVPLQAVAVGIVRLTDEKLFQFATADELVFQATEDFKHPV